MKTHSYFALLDYDCRFLYMSGTENGIDLNSDSIIGSRPWDWVPERDVATHRDNFEAVSADVLLHQFEYHWSKPDSDFERSYINVVRWVGICNVMASVEVLSLPPSFPSLTPGERTFLVNLARERTIRAISERHGTALSTLHTHSANVRRKLGLGSQASLLSFADRLAQLPLDFNGK